MSDVQRFGEAKDAVPMTPEKSVRRSVDQVALDQAAAAAAQKPTPMKKYRCKVARYHGNGEIPAGSIIELPVHIKANPATLEPVEEAPPEKSRK